MKALIIEKDYSRSVKEIPDPKINECMALVKTKVCGICGSDMKILHGVLKGTPPEMYPLVIGHEAVGEVVEVGAACTSYKIGDIVSLPFNFGIEGYGSAWGSMAEYGVVFDRAAWNVGKYGPPPGVSLVQTIVPDWMDPIDASMFNTLREPLGTMREFKLDANESIVIYGMGAIGLSFVKFASLFGLRPIIAVDIFDNKLEEAKAQGADFTVRADDPDRIKKIKEICPGGVQNVLDAVGLTSIYNEAMHLLVDHGKLCCFGVPGVTNANIDWTPAHYNWTMIFHLMIRKENEYWAHPQLLSMVKNGAVNLKDYISDYFPFSDILSVMDRFEKKEFQKKVLITF
ncbi:MAG: zinc-binding dehydrogenase [Synergistaceae bacterium]|jgi:threonine dehydrogenase-like Zn-dependent dehydrogenase|nr:zinc-binding dehydrogenase [Synergistaceae bacterium]